MRRARRTAFNGGTPHRPVRHHTNEGEHMSTPEDRQQLWELIKDIQFAMFTTRHAANGHLHARPMTTQNKRLDEDDRLWFFMSRSSESVADLAADPGVNVSYADPGKDSYVSVTGQATVSADKAKARELWNKATEAWFPGGVDDPDVALVEVRITHAHYWDVKENKLTQFFKIAKAAATGKPPSGMGESREVRMHAD
jgi:general stress protein 26